MYERVRGFGLKDVLQNIRPGDAELPAQSGHQVHAGLLIQILPTRAVVRRKVQVCRSSEVVRAIVDKQREIHDAAYIGDVRNDKILI